MVVGVVDRISVVGVHGGSYFALQCSHGRDRWSEAVGGVSRDRLRAQVQHGSPGTLPWLFQTALVAAGHRGGAVGAGSAFCGKTRSRLRWFFGCSCTPNLTGIAGCFCRGRWHLSHCRLVILPLRWGGLAACGCALCRGASDICLNYGWTSCMLTCWCTGRLSCCCLDGCQVGHWDWGAFLPSSYRSLKFVISCTGGSELLVPRRACTNVGLIHRQVGCWWLPVRQCPWSVLPCLLPVLSMGWELLFVLRLTSKVAGLLLLCISSSRHIPRHTGVKRLGVLTSRCTWRVVLLPSSAASLKILLNWCTSLEV